MACVTKGVPTLDVADTPVGTTVQLISNGHVDMDKIISHKYSLDDLVDGITKVRNREDNCTKGLIQVSE